MIVCADLLFTCIGMSSHRAIVLGLGGYFWSINVSLPVTPFFILLSTLRCSLCLGPRDPLLVFHLVLVDHPWLTEIYTVQASWTCCIVTDQRRPFVCHRHHQESEFLPITPDPVLRCWRNQTSTHFTSNNHWPTRHLGITTQRCAMIVLKTTATTIHCH
jgi:hypothetical protein